jgi:hypothetical protein
MHWEGSKGTLSISGLRNYTSVTSIYSDVAKLLLIVFLTASSALNATDRNFDPGFVDSILMAQNQVDIQAGDILQIQSTAVTASKVWDLQAVNPPAYFASIYLVILVILLLFVVLKFFYRNFFEAGLLGLPNDKVFLLHHRGNKFTDNFPWLAFFFLRLILITIAIQYGVYFFTGKPEAAGLTYFGIWMVVVASFYLLRFAAEWMVQSAMGLSKQFKVYYMQHLLITGWLWLPAIGIILILFVNIDRISMPLYAGIVAGLFITVGLFSLLRSLLLWSSELRSHLVYFFIYFCTFKILPYALALKWISDKWVLFE